jgi:TonB family protein
VLVWVLIDAEGRPAEVRIHRSSGHALLDREGHDAVKAALFKPYRREGVALAAQAIVPVEFALTVRTASR